MLNTSATMYVAGVAKGNPGEAAIGVVIITAFGHRETISQSIGMGTQSEAEWSALVSGFNKALELGITTIYVRTNSITIVNQMTSPTRPGSRVLNSQHGKALTMLSRFRIIEFSIISADLNIEAIGLCNNELSVRNGTPPASANGAGTLRPTTPGLSAPAGIVVETSLTELRGRYGDAVFNLAAHLCAREWGRFDTARATLRVDLNDVRDFEALWITRAREYLAVANGSLPIGHAGVAGEKVGGDKSSADKSAADKSSAPA